MANSLLRAGCCCGCEYGNDCEHCQSGKTPKYLTVTFSNVDANDCSGCFDISESAGPDSKSMDNVSVSGVDGKHVLAQSGGDGCVWEKAGVGGYSFSYYTSSTNCTGSYVTKAGSFTVRMRRTAGAWALEVVDESDPDIVLIYAFQGWVAETADDDCLNISGISCTGECSCGGMRDFEIFLVDGSGPTPPQATVERGDTT